MRTVTSKLLLDANLAILLAVGLTKREYTARHKRLTKYDATDLDILAGLIDRSSGVIFTPNVLTETSNLARQISEPARTEVAATLARLISRAEEHVVASRRAVLRPEYLRLGLTDAVLSETLQTGTVLITDDLDLYLAASTAGLSVLNFNHLRDQRPDFR